MIDSTQSVSALAVSATLTTTCPPAFVNAGDKHLFQTSATLHFTNPDAGPIKVDILLTLKSAGRELGRDASVFDVPPGGPTLHTVTWRHEQTLRAGDDICVIGLVVNLTQDGGEKVVSSWQVCQFRVE